MPDKQETPVALAHGALDLPKVRVDDYNLELRTAEGFLGDRASKRAFCEILEDWRSRLRRRGDDPFGDTSRTSHSGSKCSKVAQRVQRLSSR